MTTTVETREVCLRRDCKQTYPKGATFCPYCGLPVRQECPYQCGEDVPIFTNGQPTSECPNPACAHVFRHNPLSFRLFTDYELTDPETGEELISPTIPWGVYGANPARSWSIESKYAKPYAETNGIKIPLRFGDRPLTHVLYGSARLVYVQNSYLASVAMVQISSGEPRQDTVKLPQHPPIQGWSVAMGKGLIYVITPDAVQVYDSNLQLAGSAIPGSFVEQTILADGTWYGLEIGNTRCRLVQRHSSLDSVSIDFPILEGDWHRLLDFNGIPLIVSSTGEIWRLENGQLKIFTPQLQGYQVQSCLVTASHIVCLAAEEGSGGHYRLIVISPSGEVRQCPITGSQALNPQLVALGEQVCLFPQDTNSVFLQIFDLASLSLGQKQPLGIQRLVSTIGYSNQSFRSLVVAGVSMGEGEIWTVQPSSMSKTKVGRFSNGLDSVHLLLADRWIIVGHNSKNYQALLAYEMR